MSALESTVPLLTPLPSKASGVSFEEMMFLDNESGNCRAVAKLGVTVVYTPNGVTAEEWAHALQVFPQPGQIVSL